MTYKVKLLAAGSGLALSVLGAAPVFAAGTTAGSSIVNTATVAYSVGGVAQTPVTAANTLTVDRKIIVTETVVDTAPVSVSPGQNNTVTTFTVTNSSNSVIDIDLQAAAQASGVSVGFGKTSNFAAGSTIVLHTGSASGPVVTYLDEVAADATTTIYAVDTSGPAIPSTVTNGQYAGITLTATARQGGAAGSEGGTISTSTPYGGANNVFAEPAGFGADAANNGVYVASDAYVVASPTLTVNKYSYVLWDPINKFASPKSIPGAVVRYCIAVANAAGSATAVAPGVNDPLPAQVTAVAGSLFLNGTQTTGTCNTSFAVQGTAAGSAGTTTGSGASGTTAATQITSATTTVAGSLADLAAGASETLYFDTTIN